MKNVVSIILFPSLIFVLCCRPARKIQATITPKDTTKAVVVIDSKLDSLKFIEVVINKVRSGTIDFKTFSAKIKVDYTDKDGKGPDLTVFVRMQKDSVIWLSINATVFSYEAYRVMITHDSVIVQNKKDKEVQFRSIGYLQELTQLPFDFSTIQNLILGNPIYLDSNIVSYSQNESSVILLSAGKFFNHLITLSKNNFLLQHSKLNEVTNTQNRTCDLTYADYENKNERTFSTVRKINLVGKSKLDIDMNIKQYSFNETLSFPFSIPKNYKRI